MKNENAMVYLVNSTHGVYTYAALASNYPLYIGASSGPIPFNDEWLTNNSDVMGGLYTLESIFNPDLLECWENVEYLEKMGLFVRADNGEFWHVESIEGDIWAINPHAEWDDDADGYVLKEGTPC